MTRSFLGNTNRGPIGNDGVAHLTSARPRRSFDRRPSFEIFAHMRVSMRVLMRVRVRVRVSRRHALDRPEELRHLALHFRQRLLLSVF